MVPFHAVMSPVACFAAAHRPVYKSELRKLDVAQRRMLRACRWRTKWHRHVRRMACDFIRLEPPCFRATTNKQDFDMV